jgi:hypothetical protein
MKRHGVLILRRWPAKGELARSSSSPRDHYVIALRTLTAEDLLNHYCRWIYGQVGTYEATADRLGAGYLTTHKS